MEFKVRHRDPLHKSGQKQKSCGPTALSALTGYTAEAAGAWINKQRRRPTHFQNGAAYTHEILTAARSLGCDHANKLTFPSASDAPTVRRFIESMTIGENKHLWGKKLLIVAGSHFIAVYQGQVVDSGYGAEKDATPSLEYRRSRAKVRRVVEITRVAKMRKREPLPGKYKVYDRRDPFGYWDRQA